MKKYMVILVFIILIFFILLEYKKYNQLKQIYFDSYISRSININVKNYYIDSLKLPLSDIFFNKYVKENDPLLYQKMSFGYNIKFKKNSIYFNIKGFDEDYDTDKYLSQKQFNFINYLKSIDGDFIIHQINIKNPYSLFKPNFLISNNSMRNNIYFYGNDGKRLQNQNVLTRIFLEARHEFLRDYYKKNFDLNYEKLIFKQDDMAPDTVVIEVKERNNLLHKRLIDYSSDQLINLSILDSAFFEAQLIYPHLESVYFNVLLVKDKQQTIGG